MAIHLTPEENPTIQEGTLYVDSATGEFNVAGRTTPHIIPGVLYPAVSGKLLDGTTSHSGNYGTPQTQTGGDGRSYYYTDIKGSKPIKDPRIGAHFGSQRHKFKSLQLLEQETANEEVDVYSVDGREWMRARGDSWTAPNNANGNFLEPSDRLKATDSQFIEIVGYFNDANILHWASSSTHDQFGVIVNGGTRQNNDLDVSVASPLSSRYVDTGSITNCYFHASFSGDLGINTLKISNTTGSYLSVFGIELIAQDTSNRNNIQIPSQNVVSYGKKFTVSAEGSSGHHYDPFNGFTNSTTAWPTGVDTDTALGLANWQVVSGSTTTRYRPYNGGRVLKWVDSSGVIKTSVTIMPPNAQNIAGSSLSAKADASVANNTYLPTFSGAIDYSLSEVAKTFHWREFGNGAANSGGGDGKAGNADETYADASMYNSADVIAYVMDDGLTSISGDLNVHNGGYGVSVDANSKFFYVTFIGTGISWNTGGAADNPHATWAQNLPYGTHILKFANDGSNVWDGNVLLDGVDIKNDFASGSNREIYKWSAKNDITIHQPKRPPIPEDACVIADYMLMADFVPQTSREVDKISKGVRRVNASRDLFYETNSGSIGFNQATAFAITEQFGFDVAIQNGTRFFQLPYFGTGNIVHFRGNSADRATDITYSINGNAVTDANFSGISRLSASSSGITFDADGTYGQNVGSQVHNFAGVKGGISLGLNTFKNQATEASKYLAVDGIDVHTPIHTSSHYQTFETPFLHELVGGDRNMEQTNLVCSPDGKTWDQLRRDTSYIGNRDCSFSRSNNTTMGSTANWIIDDVRGSANNDNLGNKNWCVAYDRIICLRDGVYTIHFMSATSSIHPHIFLNSTSGTAFKQPHAENADGNSSTSFFKEFKRGDFLVFQGGLSDASSLNAVARYIVLHITNNF